MFLRQHTCPGCRQLPVGRGRMAFLSCSTLACLGQGRKHCGTFFRSGKKGCIARCMAAGRIRRTWDIFDRRPQKNRGTPCAPDFPCDRITACQHNFFTNNFNRYVVLPLKKGNARRQHSAARPKVSGTTTFFPRNARPYGLKRKAFQTENALGPVNTNFANNFNR